MSDEDDPLSQHLELVTKRVEKIVNGRLQQFGDQMVTLVNDVIEIRRKVTAMEAVINLQVQNNVYLMRNLNLVSQELDALEGYLAKTDPELKRLLLDCLQRQESEIAKRNLKK